MLPLARIYFSGQEGSPRCLVTPESLLRLLMLSEAAG
jgi:hypothetical protein